MAKFKSGIDLYRAASSIEKKITKPTPSQLPKNTSESTISQANPSTRKSRDSVKLAPLSRGFWKIAEEPGAGAEKAARLLLLLGQDRAAEVLSHLSPAQAEEIARQIASIDRLKLQDAQALLGEVSNDLEQLPRAGISGGPIAAKKILEAAFGTVEAERILMKVVPEALPVPFAFLEDLTFNQISALLRKENPRTLALIMGHLKKETASKLMESLPPRDRSAVVLRMAHARRISPDVIRATEETLQEKIRLIGHDETEELDGHSALASILRHMNAADERRLLGNIENEDPSLAESVREKLSSIDIVLKIHKPDFETLLLSMSPARIALILKGQPAEIKDRFHGALSQRRKILVNDEYDLLGPVPRREADQVVREFLEEVRKAEEEGSLTLLRNDEEYL